MKPVSILVLAKISGLLHTSLSARFLAALVLIANMRLLLMLFQLLDLQSLQ
jgi:hypothetical protein